MIERWMMRFLRRRGWVVFYLDEVARHCGERQVCWVELYQQEQKRERMEHLRSELPPSLRSVN